MELNQNVESDESQQKDLEKQGVFFGTAEKLFNWGRSWSLWPFQFGLACCAIEMICATQARFDISRYGYEVFRSSPRQSDVMIIAGTVTHKMTPVIERLYNQMPEPKWVIALGSCAVEGGPFYDSYAVLNGIDKVLPVDIYIPGCPPRPEALTDGMLKLKEKVQNSKKYQEAISDNA